MQISVKTSKGNTVALDVEDTDLVERIKSLIQDKLDIPVEKIDLMIEDFGQTCYQMDDYRSLRFYDVIDGSVLHLAERVQVNVRTVSGSLVASLQVSPFDSACKVKHDALVAWGKPEYMINTRLLMGEDMPFMHESMSHYNVQNGSELTLVVYDLDSGRSKE
jgi:ubiquitin C